MKKIYLMGVLLSSGLAFAQPVGSPPANNTNAQAAAAWYRGGNNPTSPNNIFGTMWNSPIYTVTNGVNRNTLMGFQPPGSITGAFGLGTNLLLPQAKLHIQDFGTDATFDAQGRMFRTDGVTTTENRNKNTVFSLLSCIKINPILSHEKHDQLVEFFNEYRINYVKC